MESSAEWYMRVCGATFLHRQRGRIPEDDGEGISLEEMIKTRKHGNESCPSGDFPW